MATHQWHLAVADAAREQLLELSSKDRMGVFRSMKQLLEAGNPTSVSGVKKLVEKRFGGQWRQRSGDWRIFFKIEHGEIVHEKHTCDGSPQLKLGASRELHPCSAAPESVSAQVLLPSLSGKTAYLLNCYNRENAESFQLLPLSQSHLEYCTATLHRTNVRAPSACSAAETAEHGVPKPEGWGFTALFDKGTLTILAVRRNEAY